MLITKRNRVVPRTMKEWYSLKVRSQLCEQSVIDIKKKYDVKTKKELVSALIKEIVQWQTFMRDDAELLKMFESINIVTTPIDVCTSKTSDGSWASNVNKDESNQVKSLKGISEHTINKLLKWKWLRIALQLN